jgi:hypothetical protein
MKLPVIENNEVVPVRFIPFITHGDYGRLLIAEILAHELKVYSSKQDEHRATIAKMKACRGQKDKQVEGIISLDEILSEDCEEEPYPSSMNWEEPQAYRLNHEGKPVLIPVAEWRVVCLEIEPHIDLAHREEEKMDIKGAMREKWHLATLEIIPADAFMWKTDLEKIYSPAKLNYNVRIRNIYRPLVEEAFDCLIKVTTGISASTTLPECLPSYLTPERKHNSPGLTNPTTSQEILSNKLPRRDFYTVPELAEYWRDELGVQKATDSLVTHYVNEGKLKTSLRYEWPGGRGWFFEDYPSRTLMIDACKTPPVEKHYIRLREAERFEKVYFRTSAPKPFLPEKEHMGEASAIAVEDVQEQKQLEQTDGDASAFCHEDSAEAAKGKNKGKSPGAPEEALKPVFREAIEAYRASHDRQKPDSFGTLKTFIRDNRITLPCLDPIENVGSTSNDCILLKNPRRVKGKKRREKKPYPLEYCRKIYSEVMRTIE